MRESTSGVYSLRFDLTLEFAQRLMSQAVGPGDRALDATVGNGHDALFLAERVGASGKVVGFDVQSDAIRQATAKLESAGVQDRVELVQAGHEKLGAWLDRNWPGEPLAGAMFNLGYLPGGDPQIVTRAENTIAALNQTLSRLRPAGLLTIVLYTGHRGGPAEADAVIDWASHLAPPLGLVLSYRFLNRTDPPSLIAICRGDP
jgi:SAM-dependent methyltransferase